MTASSVARQPVSQVRIGAASLIGTTVEYYDFAIYGLAAALVFPHVFFADNDPFVATVLALGTFAVGFIARPLGGLFFGHFGDRIGRKRMLVLSLFLMGVVTLLIGLLPSTQTIGVAAPILLVILRFVQGFAFGGEWGGAILLAYESSPESRRGFSAALPQTGPPAGILLGNMAFLAVAQLPDEQLYSWGWRIPFLCSAILVIVGLVIRAGIGESIDFENAKKNGETSTAPIRTVFQTSTGTIVLVAGAFLGFGSLSLIAINFLVSYGTSSEVGFSRSEILTAVLIANAAQLFMTPLGGALVDRIGMSRVMGTSIVGCIVTAAFLIYAVSTGNLIITIIGYLVCMSVFFSFGYAAQGSLFAGAFTPDVRYTGMSLGFQLSNVLGSAISPIIATVLVRETGSIYSVIIYVTAVLIISGICTAALLKRRANAHSTSVPIATNRVDDELETAGPA